MKTQLLSVAIGLSALTAAAHPIDFDKIQNWTGTGPNRAALVIQYNGEKYGTDAYVWGYRWEDSETPTGETMMKAICANSSRLSMLTQYTGSMGSTLCGVGYSLNQDVLKHIFFNFDKAKDFEFINFDYYEVNAFMGQTMAPGDNAPSLAQAEIDRAIAGTHYIQHPFDFGTYGYPAYDYDCWDLDAATEALGGVSSYEPKWLSAWYEGYWSYWCANNADQDFMYSGSGFTGRTLVDGAVDGWSFTQFESAMVGGMGEGVAPCEEGNTIVYMPARLAVTNIDAAKCVRAIGEGTSALPLIVRFGNSDKIDNVVLNLRFNSELPSAEQVLALLDADPAFSLDGTTLNIDADGDGEFNTSGCDTNCSGTWNLTEFEDGLLLSCDATAAPAYLVYLPAVGEVTAVVPEELTYALSDDKNYIPVFVQRDENYDAINYMWYLRSDDEPEHSGNSSDIVTRINTSSTALGEFTYKGNKAGDLYIHVRVRTGKGATYSYSNICHFTLLPPEVPVESIAFEHASVDAPLNSTIVNPITFSPENATFTGLTYSTSDNKVATANATAIRTTKTPGSAVITVSSTWDPEVKAEFEIASELRHPVTDFAIRDVEGDVIVLNPKQMIGIIADVTPADADIPDYTVELTDNGTNRDDYIATMYKVNYWDENNTRIQFYELSGHRAGECKLTLTSTDGTEISKTFTVKVEEQDRTPIEGGYTEGTLIINEEWFGHTNGGMNYIKPDGTMMYQVYERENPGMSFGCTSQYAAIWAGKLIAISKQAVDGGDPLPGGGRVVVADAATLQRQGSIDNLVFGDETKSADGRAVVGATPDKVYVGTSNGIYIVDINDIAVTGKVTGLDDSGSEGANLYAGQIGDMVHAGRYVFGIKQSTGAFAIDTETDRIVRNYPLTTVQGITQTADGHVWVASVEDGCGRFTCIDPATLDEVEDMSVTLPASVAYPTCSWGAWRNTPFVGSHSRNTIWFSAGGGIAGGSAKDKYYGWEVGSDPNSLVPVFDMAEANLTGSNARVKQKTYGTLRYDDRSGELIVMTTEDSASGHYRYNWTHFINPETGEILRTIALRPYYWFQAFAIFPDKHDAVIDLDRVNMVLKDGEKVIDLSELVSDADNVDANIKLYLVDQPATMAETEETEEEAPSTVALDGRTLTITPNHTGQHFFTLAAESNGRTVSKTVEVNVKSRTGIED
ncbi:MAG: DUF5074 domain-containing protein, partial [Muribaculaceae bacterium]|nr:DUF5074 domain-containing protein [Muribaculaceae bacterium]